MHLLARSSQRLALSCQPFRFVYRAVPDARILAKMCGHHTSSSKITTDLSGDGHSYGLCDC